VKNGRVEAVKKRPIMVLDDDGDDDGGCIESWDGYI
jgi:hypothetical protein